MELPGYKANKTSLSAAEAALKIRAWCAYQERSQHETRFKLLEYGLSIEEADLVIVTLIGENYLNEERFAIAFAGGKFRIKHWGKNKIKIEFKKHRVSDYCINKALQAIDTVEYEAVLKKVLEKKIFSLKGTEPRKVFFVALRYAVSRGFENDLVNEQLNLILKT